MNKLPWILLAIMAGCFGLILWAPSTASVPYVPTRTIEKPTDSGIRYTTIAAPCAVDEDSAHDTITALRDKDMEAFDGLTERGKVLALSAGTQFEPSGAAPKGFAWGFVRSGRHVGKDCYILQALLQTGRPIKH